MVSDAITGSDIAIVSAAAGNQRQHRGPGEGQANPHPKNTSASR